MDVIISQIPLFHIENNESKFNSNNHTDIPWDENLLTPKEYDNFLKRTVYSKWRKVLFGGHDTGHMVYLGAKECKLLLEACESGIFTGNIPEALKEDIEELIIPKIPLLRNAALPSPKLWFARLDECSTKDGIGGVGPFATADQVVRAICTSKRASKALRRAVETTSETILGTWLHLVPWRLDIDDAKEFRAFIAPGKGLTALSQYCWKRDVGWSDPKKRALLPQIVQAVQDLICELTKRAHVEEMNMPDGYVLDVHVSLPDSASQVAIQVVPIELNSFGAQMAASSALFHWINDYKRLYGLLDGVEVRIVCSQ